MAEEIINKVAEAGIEQIDLKVFLPKETIMQIDLKDQLWNEFVLKEKDFRTWLKSHDWEQYNHKNVAVFCSADAIIPAWAYMLVVSELKNAKAVFCSNIATAYESLFIQNIQHWDTKHLQDKITMVKGCSDIPNPNRAYVELTQKLLPVVKSLMFGEPCSAVPVFKRKA